MSQPEPTDAMRAALVDDERIEWFDTVESVAWGSSERFFAVILSVIAGFFVTGFASQEGWVSGFGGLLAFPVAAVVVWLAFRHFGNRAGAGQRAYAITDRRVLVHDGEELKSFGPADVAGLEVQQQSDGSWDVFWGQRDAPRVPLHMRQRREGDAAVRGFLRVPRRAHRVGLLGLPSAEPAQSLVRALRTRHLDRAAVGEPGGMSGAPVQPMIRPSTLAQTSAAPKAAGAQADAGPLSGWRRIEERTTGFAVDVPSAWKVKTGTVKRGRFLGIRFEGPEPRWVDPAVAGWNRLELQPDVDGTALRIDIDPDAMPASLDEVLSSRWARVLNMKLLGSEPAVSAAGLTGFAAAHSLKGVGVGVGGLRIGGTMKADLLQRQIWLRGAPNALHLIVITPADSDALRDTMARVVASMRFGSGAR